MNLPTTHRTHTVGFRPRSSQPRPSTSTSTPPSHKKTYDRLVKEEVMELYSHTLDKHFIESIMKGDELNDEALKELLMEFILQPRFAHGEIIKEGEPYFRCLDCEVLKNTNQRTYLCRTCFEKTNHKGHRFLLFNDATGYETCDCGNESLLNPHWFCPDHGTCSKDDYKRVISVVPPSYLKNFNKVFKSIIYELVFACEVHRQGIIPNLKGFIDKVMEALLATMKYCINLNSIFLVLIAEVISQPLKHPKNFKKRFFLIEGRYVKHHMDVLDDNLNMTYLENMLRYSFIYREDIQKQFREVLLKLACAEEFKKKLVISFQNVAHHLFYVRPQTLFYFSDLAHLTSQIYASEENCLRVIKECSFDNLLQLLQQYGKNYEPHLDPESETLSRCLHPFELILEKESSGRKLIEKEGIVGQFLDVIIGFQKNHSYNVQELINKLKVPSHVENILNYWDYEEQMFAIIEKLVRSAGYILDKVGWDQDPGLFLIDWGERANNEIENNDITQVYLNLPLQRSMVAYLQNTLDRIDKEKMLKQLEYIRRSSPEAIHVLIGQAIATIGTMRQSMIRLNGWDIESNPVIYRYFIQDGLGELSLFDYDFTFVQVFSLLLDEDEVNIFELYYKNYFANDKELIEIFENADFERVTEQQMRVFEDFFNFLVQVLHGEISFFNIFYKSSYLTDHTSKKIIDQIHRKILITFLHKTYNFFPITTLKHDFRFILRKDIFHEKILKDLADIDNETKTFKLKTPYCDLFDSFYLYPDHSINSKIIMNVRAHNKMPEIAELGNFTHSLPFLELLQQRTYEGHIIDWFSKFFEKFTTNSTCIVPSIVRLIVLPLKLLEHAKRLKLTRKFKEKVIFGFFGTKHFLDKLKKAFSLVTDPNVQSPLAKLINIFIPRSNIGSTINSFNFVTEDAGSMFDAIASMDPSELQRAIEAQQGTLSNIPTVNAWDEHEFSCGLCRGKLDLTSEDVGIPTYISRSNVNYWELKGRKFRKPHHNADRATLRLILLLIKRYYPYAEGLNAHDVDLMEGYVPPKLKLDFYPALTSCMHYLHRSCFKKAYTLVPGSAQEFECPICRKLNNAFIGMEKVDAASREILEEQIKKSKKFLGFLKKQGVLINTLPDPNLRFDFYNNFMHALFPNNTTLELKNNDNAADTKILKFTSLMRTSFFQLVRNSMVYDFETFMSRSYVCYKFAFVNLQSFVMKNTQFHQYFENLNQELAPTIFHVLNHPTLMEGLNPPNMKQLYEVYREALGLQEEQMIIKRKEDTAEKKKKAKKVSHMKSPDHHDHTRKLPQLPTDWRKKTSENFRMTRKNKQIMLAYNYNQNAIKSNEMVFGSQEALAQTMRHTMGNFGRTTERPIFDMTGALEDQINTGRSRGSTPDESNDYKEEELFDTLQKMLLLLENETEEDFLLAFWESFLRFMLTNRMKDHHTNIDLSVLALDFLYLRTLAIFTRTLLSEKVLKAKQHKIPDFEKMCDLVAKNPDLRADFIEEMINLTQRIVVASVLIFDFDKCMEIKNKLQLMNELRGNREFFLNQLLGFVKKDLTLDVILSKEMWDLKPDVYKNFFGVWKENLVDFLKKTRNPFELFVKNVTEVKQLMIELPSNFNEFNSEYLPKRCDLCGEFCQACRTVLCVLCGKVMCRDKCFATHDKKSKKDKKKKRKRRMKKKVTTLASLDTSVSDLGSDINSLELDSELPEGMKTPVKPKRVTPKDEQENYGSNGSLGSVDSSGGGSTSRIRKVKIKTKSDIHSLSKIPNIDILAYKERPSIEIGMMKSGNLSPISAKMFTTPTKPTRLTIDYVDTKLTGSGPSSENLRGIKTIQIPSRIKIGKTDPGVKNLGLSNILSVRSNNITKSPNFTRTSYAPSTTERLTTRTVLESAEKSFRPVDMTETEKKKKKRRKKKKHTNMHKHADEAHRGHTVYICVQDQTIVLFSAPREVKYIEKLYVDKFGQSLRDKVNIFDEDWNSFTLNPFVLRKLREAVENHSLPQLIFSIIIGEVKAK